MAVQRGDADLEVAANLLPLPTCIMDVAVEEVFDGRFGDPASCRIFTLILLSCLVSSEAWCQRDHLQAELGAAFKNKVLLLRNFYSGNNLEYDQSGVLSGVATQGSWMLANIRIKSVAVTAQGIEIVGNRMASWYRDGKLSLVEVGKLRIGVVKPISDADDETTLRTVFHKIFIESGEDLHPLVPAYWQSYLSGNDKKSRLDAWSATLEREGPPTVKASDASGGIVSPPRALYSPDPKYTKEAASHGIEGVSVLGIVVDGAGKTADIAILSPLGFGLDEQAVLAVKGWNFQPASRNGRPIRVQVNVEIMFKCCP